MIMIVREINISIISQLYFETIAATMNLGNKNSSYNKILLKFCLC